MKLTVLLLALLTLPACRPTEQVDVKYAFAINELVLICEDLGFQHEVLWCVHQLYTFSREHFRGSRFLLQVAEFRDAVWGYYPSVVDNMDCRCPSPSESCARSLEGRSND